MTQTMYAHVNKRIKKKKKEKCKAQQKMQGREITSFINQNDLCCVSFIFYRNSIISRFLYAIK
jgi:hypothetical protein